MKTGRNDPCPCGSGKKYKRCCLGNEVALPSPPVHEEFHEDFPDLKSALQSRIWASMEEAQDYADRHVRDFNLKPLADFHGLSPDHMRRLIYHPWECPELVEFPPISAASFEIPLLFLFDRLVEGITRGNLKATVKGNLPRHFVRETALALWGEDKYREETRFRGINSETDFRDLNRARLVCGMAGLIRTYKGRFILSRLCKQLVAEPGKPRVYPILLHFFAEEFNWGYGDRFPELAAIQSSFLFSLYLLHRYGDSWKPHSFYEDAFVRAFPVAMKEIVPDPYFPPEKMVRLCYRWRCLRHAAEYLGLAEIRMDSPDPLELNFHIRKSPLLDEAVIFHI